MIHTVKIYTTGLEHKEKTIHIQREWYIWTRCIKLREIEGIQQKSEKGERVIYERDEIERQRYIHYTHTASKR